MIKFWLFVSILLDVFPWLFLMYMPFRDRLRMPFWKTVLVSELVLVPYQLGFMFSAGHPFATVTLMFEYRIFQLVLLVGITSALVKDKLVKVLFVFGLMFPCMSFVLATSVHIKFIVAPEGSLYIASSLIRAALSAILFPFLWWYWKKVLCRGMQLHGDFIWKCMWPIPAVFTVVCLVITDSDFEIVGISTRLLFGYFTFFVGVLVVCYMTLKLIERAEYRIRQSEEAQKSELLLQLQEEQYKLLATSFEQARKDRHDVRHHVETCISLLQNGESDECLKYLIDLSGYYETISMKQYCGNTAVNALVSHFAQSKDDDVSLDVSLSIGQDIGIATKDLCIIIGNLVENALEACERITTGCRKVVKVKSMQRDGRLYLTVTNPYQGELKIDNNRILSEKRDRADYGIGLASVEAACTKYDGGMQLSADDGVFTVNIHMKTHNE